jgi:hybrid cluster-associated redox disulfide protein
MKKVKASITIDEIIKANPSAIFILEQFGLGCAHCGLGTFETLEEGAKAHGLSDIEIKKLVEMINLS